MFCGSYLCNNVYRNDFAQKKAVCFYLLFCPSLTQPEASADIRVEDFLSSKAVRRPDDLPFGIERSILAV
jgi:hypothetical protein